MNTSDRVPDPDGKIDRLVQTMNAMGYLVMTGAVSEGQTGENAFTRFFQEIGHPRAWEDDLYESYLTVLDTPGARDKLLSYPPATLVSYAVTAAGRGDLPALYRDLTKLHRRLLDGIDQLPSPLPPSDDPDRDPAKFYLCMDVTVENQLRAVSELLR